MVLILPEASYRNIVLKQRRTIDKVREVLKELNLADASIQQFKDNPKRSTYQDSKKIRARY